MKLYKLKASDCRAFWGDPMDHDNVAPVRSAVVIGQAPDCSSFLILSTEAEPYLDVNVNLGEFVFTYCQEWGLTITPAVVRRVIGELRDKELAKGFSFENARYSCDPVFQGQIQGFLVAWREGILPISATVSIRRADNAVAEMGNAAISALAGALMQHVKGIYERSWAAKDAIPD